MKEKKTGNVVGLIRHQSWFLIILWTVCISASLLWNLYEQKEKFLQIARNSAQITFEKDVLYRRWAAKQGGVYVPVSEHTPVNPYLDVPNRDVTTSSGLHLTLVNPAYMTRQVNQMAAEGGAAQGHITSLNPIRPQNKPDPWEAAVLRSFEKGVQETSSVEKMGGEEYMRLMRPFKAEKDCLKCHAAQGYKEGDIRGGISVSVPMAPFRAIERPLIAKISLGHFLLWLVGIAGIMVSKKALEKEIFAREKAEAVLHESENILRIVADFTYDWEYWRAPDGSFLYMSPSCEQITGYTRQEFIQDPKLYFRIIHPEDRGLVVSHVQEGGPCRHELEFRILRPDGEERWIGHTCQLVVDADGKSLGRRASDRDITKRKKAEAELYEAKRLLERERDVLESVMSGAQNFHLVYLDRDFNFVRVNKTYARTCGYTPEEMVGKNHFSLYPHEENEAIFTRVRDTGIPVEFHDKPFVFPDQPERGITYWDWTLIPIKDASGRVEGLVFSLFETTERRRMEEALRESEERFRLMADTMPNLVWTAQPDGRVDYRSSYSFKFTGLPEGRPCENSKETPIHPDDLPGIKDVWKKAVQNGKPYQIELRVKRFDGEYRWHLSRAIPVRESGGRIKKWVGTATEIHDLREARTELEKRVQERTAELARANAILGESEKRLQSLSSQLIAAQENERRVVAQELHDSIGANLSAIKHSLETKLDQVQKDGEACAAVSFHEVLGLLKQTIDENRRIQLNLRPSILDDLGILSTIRWFLRETRKAHPGISAEEQVRIKEQDVPENLKIVIFRLVQESVSNAVRHGKAGVIRIGLEKTGAWIRLTVKDNGIGFESATKRNSLSGGMGLESMQQRVESSKGLFSITSNLGQGTLVKAEWKIEQ